MKKYIFLIVSFLFLSVYAGYSQPDCSDVTCPDGWTLGQTGWIPMKLNDDPGSEAFCVVKICYCYDFEDLEEPNFEIKRVVFSDSTCLEEYIDSIDYDYFKTSILEEIIRNHSDELPVIFCDDGYYTTELTVSFCYAAVIWNGIPMLVYCEGDGFCVQTYKYCWDKSESPWKLVVEKSGGLRSWPSPCYLPLLPGGIDLIIQPCIPWCY